MADRSGVNSLRARTLIAVREMILRGEFSSHKRLEEVELSRRLGASRPIIHATLEKLHHEGLVQPFTGGGYAARVFTDQDIADAIEARGALESLAAGLAAGRHPDRRQIEHARRLNAELAQTTTGFDSSQPPTPEEMARFGELNLAFHKALVALAKSPMVQLSLDRVQSIAFASPAAVVVPSEPFGFRQAVQEHEAILDAIQHGDATRAENLVRDHARFALRGVRSALEKPVQPAAKKRPSVSPAPEPVIISQTTDSSDSSGPTAELMLDAAAALFCEKGFNETTTREIAARLNIHQASLYYHISGKEDLLYRISKRAIEPIEEKVKSALESVKAPRERLRTFIQAHLDGLFENANVTLAAIGEFRALSRPHRKEMVELRRQYSDRLQGEIAGAVKSGDVRSDIPASVLRLALLNYLNWTPRWYQPSGPLAIEELARIYDKVFFEGIATPGQARPSVPVLPSPRRRTGTAHSGTLGKFVRTAAELFSKQGYASTSTRSISTLIGMEKATLYYHVKSKEDLLYLICKSSVEALHADVYKAIEGIACPLEQMSVLIQAHCISLLRNQTQHATALAEVRALSPQRLGEIVSLRKDYQTRIRQIIEAGQQSGSIRSDIEPRYLASMLRGLLDRVVEWYQKDGKLSPAELAASFCDIYISGAGNAGRRTQPKVAS